MSERRNEREEFGRIEMLYHQVAQYLFKHANKDEDDFEISCSLMHGDAGHGGDTTAERGAPVGMAGRYRKVGRGFEVTLQPKATAAPA